MCPFSSSLGLPLEMMQASQEPKVPSGRPAKIGVNGSRWSRGQDLMGKRLAIWAIRLLVSVNLLYAAIVLKFAGSDSVTVFTLMSQAFHGLVSQPVCRLGVRGVRDGSGGSAPDPEDNQIGSGIWLLCG